MKLAIESKQFPPIIGWKFAGSMKRSPNFPGVKGTIWLPRHHLHNKRLSCQRLGSDDCRKWGQRMSRAKIQEPFVGGSVRVDKMLPTDGFDCEPANHKACHCPNTSRCSAAILLNSLPFKKCQVQNSKSSHLKPKLVGYLDADLW